MLRSLPFLLPLSLPLSVIAATTTDATWLMFYPAVVFLFFVPALDWVLAPMKSPDTVPLGGGWLWLPQLYCVLHLAALSAVLATASSLSVMGLLAAISSLGLVGGVGITAYHELLHKRERTPKALGRIGMLLALYPHFEVNHLESHHRYACTPEDHSTAWLGESSYAFLWRTIPACLRTSIALERRRHGERWILRSITGRGLIAAFIVCLVLGLSSVSLLAVFLVQAALAVLQLEVVAYIEHYGLMRSAGQQRGPLPREMSWDSRHRVSNYLTFKLQHHAAHHASSSKPFNELDLSPRTPQLPCGYPLMISVALLPPLWRRIIHPRLPI